MGSREVEEATREKHKADVMRFLAALQVYGQHTAACAMTVAYRRGESKGQCTCGLAEAVEATVRVLEGLSDG